MSKKLFKYCDVVHLYRPLKEGEIIQIGDCFLASSGVLRPTQSIGCRYSSRFYRLYFRIKTTTTRGNKIVS